MRLFVLAASIAACACVARAEEPAKDAEIEKLFADLKSDEFSVREKAVHELSERADKVWERLQKISEDDPDPDVRVNAQIIMAAPTQRFFEAVGLRSKSEIAELEALLAEQKTRYEASVKKLELKRSGTAEERDTVDAKLVEAGRIWEEFQKTARDKMNESKTRLSVYAQIAKSDLILRPAELVEWTPAKLPLEKRLKLRISFEFVDCPLKDALAFVERTACIKMEFGPNLSKSADGMQNITLRVSDMSADLSLDWILKLCSASKKLDAEHEMIIVDSP